MSATSRLLRHAAIALGLVAAHAATTAQAQSNYPNRDITLVVQSSAGGGSDIIARTIANVIQQKQLVPDTAILVENRPGGGGAIAYNYIAKRKGNPYYIGTLATSFFTAPLMGLSPTTYKDFTPIAAIAADPFVLVVNANSPIQSLDDIKAMDSIRVGNTGAVTDPAMLGAHLAKELGVQLRAVPFNGDSEVTTALLGNHIDLQFGNASEVMNQIRAGRVRPLAVTSEQRLDSLPDVPTFKDLGLDIELVLYRGLMMPANMPESVIAYWENVLRQVAESEEWHEQYIARNNSFPIFLGHKEFSEEVPKISARYEQFMKDVQAIK